MSENVRQISYSETQKCQSGPRAGNSVGPRSRTGGSRIEFDDHGAPAMQGLLLAGFDHTRQQQVFTRRYEQNGTDFARTGAIHLPPRERLTIS